MAGTTSIKYQEGHIFTGTTERGLALVSYKTTAVYDEESLPAGFLKNHSTKAGVWGLIHVLEGILVYTDCATGLEIRLVPGEPHLVLPQAEHSVRAPGPVRFFVEFLRPDEIGAKKDQFPDN